MSIKECELSSIYIYQNLISKLVAPEDRYQSKLNTEAIPTKSKFEKITSVVAEKFKSSLSDHSQCELI